MGYTIYYECQISLKSEDELKRLIDLQNQSELFLIIRDVRKKKVTIEEKVHYINLYNVTLFMSKRFQSIITEITFSSCDRFKLIKVDNEELSSFVTLINGLGISSIKNLAPNFISKRKIIEAEVVIND